MQFPIRANQIQTNNLLMSEDLFDYVNVKHTATTYSSTVHVNQGADKYI